MKIIASSKAEKTAVTICNSMSEY